MAWTFPPWRTAAEKPNRKRGGGHPAVGPDGRPPPGAAYSSPVGKALRRVADPFRLAGALVELTADGPLGARGAHLAMPFDRVMFPLVMEAAAWQMQDVEFMAGKLDPAARYVLLDIGANVGLFTRQAVRRIPGIARAICVEPDPANFAALRYNLSGLPEAAASLWNVGLGAATGEQAFFRDRRNAGNYSLSAESMLNGDFEETRIKVVETAAWMDGIAALVPPGHRLIWKSDTQGHDELIVSRTPVELWSRVDVAVMELCRYREPVYDRTALARRLDALPHRSIGHDGDGAMTTAAIMDYLRGSDGVHRDLFLWR